MRRLFRRRRRPRAAAPPPTRPAGPPLSRDLDENVRAVTRAFGDSTDLVIREIVAGAGWRPYPTSFAGPAAVRPRMAVAHFAGLVDDKLLSDNVLKPLVGLSLRQPAVEGGRPGDAARLADPAALFDAAKNDAVTVTDLMEVSDLPTALSRLAAGDALVLIDGHPVALACGVQGWAERPIEEPASESTVRGPREGFNESLGTNLALLRRHVQDPRLRFEKMLLGRLTHTAVVVAYIKGLVSPDLLAEVRSRLSRLDTDAVQTTEYLEECIEDDPFSPFPQVFRTERPDRVIGSLLEGRVAIIADGTPFVLVVPATLAMFLRSVEDYYERPFIASFLGLIRFASFFISLTLPALYIAITTFHQELLPTPLILSIAAQREGIPFPALVEALLLEFAFDVLREAGIRLPKVIGTTISIVGILVIGQAAVQAGLVSGFMVVIVAFTGLASYTTPLFSIGLSVRILHYGVMLLAGFLGLFGIVIAMSALLIHLCCLRSFGHPYLEPFAPVVVADLKDTIVRAPWWAMDTRPALLARADRRRQKPGLRPRKPREGAAG